MVRPCKSFNQLRLVCCRAVGSDFQVISEVAKVKVRLATLPLLDSKHCKEFLSMVTKMQVRILSLIFRVAALVILVVILALK